MLDHAFAAGFLTERELVAPAGKRIFSGLFVVTAGIAFAVLFTLERSRDVIWIGVVHYLMDIAIGAFEV